jgi:hypothetical protein
VWSNTFIDKLNKQFSKLKVQEIEGRIEKELREDPESGDLIEGTHGLRKLRVSDGNKGKSGSLRVLYLDVKSKERIYIIAFFPKSVKENLSNSEKKILADIVLNIKSEAENDKKTKKK